MTNLEFARRTRRLILDELSPVVGIGPQFISLFERKRLIPSDSQRERLARALNIPPELLLEEAVAVGIPPVVDEPNDPAKDQEYVDIALGAQNEPTTA